MVGAAFRTDLTTMATASQHVIEVNEHVQASLRDLLTRLEPLLGTWQGGAAASFHVLKERWHDQARQLNDALLAIGERLGQAGVTYAESDDANRAGFTGLTAGLG